MNNDRDRGTGTETSPPSSRRRLLARVGAASTLGVAGCLVDDDGNGDDAGNDSRDDEPDGENSTDDGSDEPGDDGDLDVDEGGPPTASGWELTFEDTFSDGELDRSKWTHGPGYYYSCAQGSLECWEEDHVWVDDETDRLVIQSSDEPSSGGDDEAAGDRDYTAGGINTRDAFVQEFGYFEAKTRPPAEPGALPAFWAWWNPDTWDYRREIDVYEITGDEPLDPIHNVHTNCEPSPDTGPTEYRGGRSELDEPADETFHVWGVEWAPESVTFYVDGDRTIHVEDEVISDCLAGEAMWLLVSSHVNDDHGDPTEADYPYTHEVEWVRAWQHEDWE